MTKSSLFNLETLKDKKGLLAGDLLAVDPELYSKFMLFIDRTVKRDKITKNMVFLTGLSAYTKEPINLFLRGESSIGKTYNVREVLKLFPREDVWFLGGLSPTALVHEKGELVDRFGQPILPSEKPDKNASEMEKEAWRERLRDSRYIVDLQGKILVFLEAPHIQTYYMLRPILSHDVWEISYKFTDRSGKGQLKTMHVVIRGWPATIFCSTKEHYIHDLATRGFTITPETTKQKFQDANILTGEKSAFPWKFRKNFDFLLLQGYIGFLKNKLQEIDVVIPYAPSLGEKFPSKFPRCMRDFKNILSLIKVHALFHFAQRPILTREIEGKQEIYILAVRRDYEFAMKLWAEIRETTETFAPGHIIKFFRQVVKETAREKSEFRVEDLVEKWNSKFEDERSSHAIRKWVEFLCNIGYMDKKPDPNDKRRNVLTIIKTNEKNGNYEILDFSVFFTLNSLKEWFRKANEILEEKPFLLKETLLSESEASSETIWEKYYSKNSISSNILLSQNNESTAQRTPEKTEKQKIKQFPFFQEIKQIVKLDKPHYGTCAKCNVVTMLYWQLQTFKGQFGDLCEECGRNLIKQKQKICD